jgi:formylglycine-generating enzyme required for sulfatase activity
MAARVSALLLALPLAAIVNCGTVSGISAENGTGSLFTPVNPYGQEAGATCTMGTDCKSDRCEEGVCAVQPSTTTTTTGGAPECKAHSDCKTGCGDDGKCASAPSCTQAHGGRSCGADGNDDCCAVAKQGAFTVDKYLITAGRMRAFVDRFDGNIKGFVDSLPAEKWKASWSNPDAIPSDRESANVVLGPAGKKACNQGAFTGHTYWTPKTDDDFSDFDQATLDEKALNCVPWAMLQALCAWDGGHLATMSELKAAFTNDGTTKYPWGNEDLASASRPDAEERLNLEAAYRTPTVPASFRKNENGDPSEVSFLISPPGRFPKGNNKAGIADSAGNLLEWVGDQERQFVWKGDFEHHAANAATFNGYIWWEARNNSPLGVGRGSWIWGESQLYGNAGSSNEKHGYYSIGGRCAH